MTIDKRKEITEYLNKKHNLKLDLEGRVGADQDLILDLLCLIVDQVAPNATREADAILAERIESLVMRLQEANRGDLGELAALKSKEVHDLTQAVIQEIGRTKGWVGNLTTEIEKLQKLSSETNRLSIKAEGNVRVILLSIAALMAFIVGIVMALAYMF